MWGASSSFSSLRGGVLSRAEVGGGRGQAHHRSQQSYSSTSRRKSSHTLARSPRVQLVDEQQPVRGVLHTAGKICRAWPALRVANSHRCRSLHTVPPHTAGPIPSPLLPLSPALSPHTLHTLPSLTTLPKLSRSASLVYNGRAQQPQAAQGQPPQHWAASAEPHARPPQPQQMK